MAKAIIYSDEDVLAAQQVLRSKTARKVGKTRSQVAEFLADDIRKALEQGYSLKDIKNILAETGISVSIARMQAVLDETRKTTQESSGVNIEKGPMKLDKENIIKKAEAIPGHISELFITRHKPAGGRRP